MPLKHFNISENQPIYGEIDPGNSTNPIGKYAGNEKQINQKIEEM